MKRCFTTLISQVICGNLFIKSHLQISGIWVYKLLYIRVTNKMVTKNSRATTNINLQKKCTQLSS